MTVANSISSLSGTNVSKILLSKALVRLPLALPCLLLASACSDLQMENFENPNVNNSPASAITVSQSTSSGTNTTLSSNGALALTPPAVILQSRIVDLQQLRPEVTVIPGGLVDMTPAADLRQWSGVINVPANAEVSVSIEWFEQIQSNGESVDLQLAGIQQTIMTDEQAAAISFTAEQYETEGFDDDMDGVSNLAERNASTNPFDERDAPPPTPGSNTEVSVVIPQVVSGSVPQIDGLGATYAANELRLTGEWGSAVQEATNGELFIDSLMINEGNEDIDTEPFHSWAALHDGTFLYILVLVDDASLNFGDSAQLFDDDSIEIFIDGNNSNLDSYGDADDRYFRIGLLASDGSVPHTSESSAPRIERGENSAPIPDNIEFAVGPATGPLSIANPGERLDVYEVKIELASFGVAPGQPFGFEVQINDDDNGEIRNQKWGWFHPVKRGSGLDLTVSNPAFMGTAQLAQ